MRARSWWIDYGIWLLVGLGLRILLMPTAAYGDLHAIAYAIHLMAFEGVGNIYVALHNLPAGQSPVPLLGVDFFPYPPLTYYVLGAGMFLLRPAYGDAFQAAVSAPFAQLVAQHDIMVWLTLYKLPLLIADLATAFVLMSCCAEPSRRRLAFRLWLLNPVPIIATYLFGQFDVLPAFFVALAYLAALRGKAYAGAVALGVGAGFKFFPLLLLLPFALIVGNSLWKRLTLGLSGLAVFGLSLLPVMWSPVAMQVMFGSDPSRRVLRAGIPLGENLGNIGIVYLVLMLYTIVVLHVWRSAQGRREALLPGLLAVLLLTYGFSFSHLQWLTWSVPLLVLDWVHRPENRPAQLVLYGAALLVGLSWQVGPLLEFFQPVSQTFARSLPSLNELIAPMMNPADAANIWRSMFAGAALYWTYANLVHLPQVDRTPVAMLKVRSVTRERIVPSSSASHNGAKDLYPGDPVMEDGSSPEAQRS